MKKTKRLEKARSASLRSGKQLEDMIDIALCSECLQDQGLKLDAVRIGTRADSPCPNCGSRAGSKLSKTAVEELAHRFFVRGTIRRFKYGAAPAVQFNEHQRTSINTSPWFESDVRLIEKTIGMGFFYYGPRLWMLGEVDPLVALQDPAQRESVIKRIITEYPCTILTPEQVFYRVRKDPQNPADSSQYDTPPNAIVGSGRLDSPGLPALYGSQDLQVCIHECRVTAEDELFVATLAPNRDLRLLNLTEILQEENANEFTSLDMAVHMLFLAGKHSYDISRAIALAAHASGYDGLAYPSYFSLLRTGAMPFETSYGITHRRFPHFAEHENAKIIPNLALFGRPIQNGEVTTRCLNKLILQRVEYDIHFGPVGH